MGETGYTGTERTATRPMLAADFHFQKKSGAVSGC